MFFQPGIISLPNPPQHINNDDALNDGRTLAQMILAPSVDPTPSPPENRLRGGAVSKS